MRFLKALLALGAVGLTSQAWAVTYQLTGVLQSTGTITEFAASNTREPRREKLAMWSCRNRNLAARSHNDRHEMLTEYLERALSLERLAADEQDATFKTALLSQAAAYRKLAAKRAKEYGLPAPSPPNNPT